MTSWTQITGTGEEGETMEGKTLACQALKPIKTKHSWHD